VKPFLAFGMIAVFNEILEVRIKAIPVTGRRGP
jgi:hypothetical protein